MNRKKDLKELTEDQLDKKIQKAVRKAIQAAIQTAVQKSKPIITFESEQLKINGLVVADFSRFTSNNDLISDIVYKNGDKFESIIFYNQTYDNINEYSGKYYLLTSDDEHGGYFDSLTIITN